jgi:type I restriction enzyme M protein
MPKRKIVPADYIARRSLYLTEKDRYDRIVQQAAGSGADLPKLVTDAMTAIEAEFEPLLGVLPKVIQLFGLLDAKKSLEAGKSVLFTRGKSGPEVKK